MELKLNRELTGLGQGVVDCNAPDTPYGTAMMVQFQLFKYFICLFFEREWLLLGNYIYC